MSTDIPSLGTRIVGEWPWWAAGVVLLIITFFLLQDEIVMGELVTAAAAIVTILVGLYRVRAKGSPFR